WLRAASMMRRKRSGSRGLPRRGWVATSSSVGGTGFFLYLTVHYVPLHLLDYQVQYMEQFMTPAVHRDPLPGAWPIRLVPAAAALAILSACSVPPMQPPATSVPLPTAFAQAGPAAAAVQAFD